MKYQIQIPLKVTLSISLLQELMSSISPLILKTDEENLDISGELFKTLTETYLGIPHNKYRNSDIYENLNLHEFLTQMPVELGNLDKFKFKLELLSLYLEYFRPC